MGVSISDALEAASASPRIAQSPSQSVNAPAQSNNKRRNVDIDDANRFKDRPLDPFRSPRSPQLHALITDITDQLERYEHHERLRNRRRRPADRAIFLDIVSALISDAIHRELSKPGGRVMASLSKAVLGRKDRYGSPVLSEQLPDILRRLASRQMGWLDFEQGHRGWDGGPGKQTTFAASERLKARMGELQVTLGDLGRRPGGEVLILKRAKEAHWDEGGRVDYPDTPDTYAMREELEAINAWLEQADLQVDEWELEGREVDLGDRRLLRVFNNGRFDHGGRLFGGFWQRSKKVRAAVMFGKAGKDGDGDEPSVELDYAQTSLRILYGMAGATPPAGDLYAVPGMEHGRELVKEIANSLLFKDTPVVRYPVGTRRLKPLGWTFSAPEVTERFLTYHPAIRELIWEPDVGFRVLAVESRVVTTLLTRLMALEVVALPVHDAVVIPSSCADTVRGVMEGTFREVVGTEGVVRGGVSREEDLEIPQIPNTPSLHIKGYSPSP